MGSACEGVLMIYPTGSSHMEVLNSMGVVVSLSLSQEKSRSKAHIQMSYHFANPNQEEEEVYL